MNQLDVFYRALLKYRAETLEVRSCVAGRNALMKVNTESDRLVLTRMVCTVETDWVDAIEQGLVWVEKAIREERQFIRTNGEVVPIEKVKHVSKDSVEHLARHSNLITRKIEGEDLIPDNLYTVEKLSDYAVYENRFLYMLLCYLRDFITLRYDRILEASNTYDGQMTMKKVVQIGKQSIEYEVKLAEVRKDDAYLREHNEAKAILSRIDLLLKTVMAFLATPLMQFTSKAPMLKPPITKTNVLKMNNNFKQAMALYEYVTAYDKVGYTIETRVKEMSPFREDVGDELAETVLLSSFLTYEHTLGLEQELRESYEKEEKRRKDEEFKQHCEALEKARSRVRNSGMSFEEYILMLEKQVRLLEDRCSELDTVRAENERLTEELMAAREQIETLSDRVVSLEAELEAQIKKYLEDMAALKAEYEETIRVMEEAHAEEIRQLNEEHQAEIERLKEEHAEEIRLLLAAHAEEIQQLKDAHAEEIRQLKDAHLAELDALKAAHEARVAELGGQIEALEEQKQALVTAHAEELANLRATHRQALEQLEGEHRVKVEQLDGTNAEQRATIESMLREKEQMITEKRLMSAQLHALRRERGLIPKEEDYTSKENFTELEHEFEVFKRFYREEWGKTKKTIRKTLLKPEQNSPRGKNGGHDET